jgi:hypothetical protein
MAKKSGVKKVEGTLNSKEPNPFELAYKQVWDSLPKWKQNAITEDIANSITNSRVHEEFAKRVNEVAESMYVSIENN